MDKLKMAETWWRPLADAIKQALIEDYYPDGTGFMDVDELWDGLTEEDKVEMWEMY